MAGEYGAYIRNYRQEQLIHRNTEALLAINGKDYKINQYPPFKEVYPDVNANMLLSEEIIEPAEKGTTSVDFQSIFALGDSPKADMLREDLAEEGIGG